MKPWHCCLVLAAVLAGCATPEPPSPPAVTAAPDPAPSAPAPVLGRDTLKYLANRQLKPIEDRPLNAKANCSFRDPTGYRGRLRLDVREAKVQKLDARLDMPRKGSCDFALKDFQQTGTMPIVVLAGRKTNCQVSLWEQEDKVTVAFRNCQSECSGNSVEYLWPILVDNRKGSCS